MTTKTKKIVCFSVSGFVLAVIIALNIVLASFSSMISAWLSISEASEATRQAGKELAAQIVEEGVVMVKNDKKTLPLKKAETAKINVFGWASTQWVMCGSGSGQSLSATNKGDVGKLTPAVDLISALNDYGIETNTALTDMYRSFQDNRPYWGHNNDSLGALHTYPEQLSRLYEPNITDKSYYSDELLADAKAFSDTAIVVLGRVTGESNDCPQIQYKKGVTDDTRTYLDISAEEEALLKYVGENYAKTVVVINSTNTMNLGFMDKLPGLNSCLIVGCTGDTSASVLPKLLYGEISPSGRTVDTQVYDFKYHASYVNSGLNGVGKYEGSAGLYPAIPGVTNPNVGNSAETYAGASYLDYVEGIYVGYKWFETADAEGFWDSEFAKTELGVQGGYSSVVQYPFGFGLSYTDFDWFVLDSGVSDGKFSMKVRVSNTGDMAGRDVLELYYTPPYTPGGVEKSAIELVAFEKTHMIEPGAYEDIVLFFDISDMMSYDVSDGGAYVLEAGDYIIKLMTDAHTPRAVSGAQYTYTVAADVVSKTDPTTGRAVKNRFTGDSAVDFGISLDGSTTGENITYMTRADFAGTFPLTRKPDRAMAQKLKDTNLYTAAHAAAWETAWNAANPDAAMPEFGQDYGNTLFVAGEITDFGLELGADYYDEQWEILLDQVTREEASALVRDGYIKEKAISSVGKPQTNSLDGPSQLGSFNANKWGVSFPNATLLAQTWSKEIAYNFGLSVGKEAKEMNIDGWYAPGVNLHRSAFGGRNYEYYSEDSHLSGMLCANTVRGALNAGVYTYIKHFIGYDQESLRDGLYCWMEEQALRETYLSPYKLAIDRGGATGIMSSYGRIGAVWSGGSEALLTSVLRDEWDFKGAVLTDYSDHQQFMNGDQMLRAGGDLWMAGYLGAGNFNYDNADSVAVNTQLRRATKNVLYMVLNAAYTNANYNETADVPIITGGIGGAATWWIGVLVAVDVVTVLGLGTWIFFTLWNAKKAAAKAAAGDDGSASEGEPAEREVSEQADAVEQSEQAEPAAEEATEQSPEPSGPDGERAE